MHSEFYADYGHYDVRIDVPEGYTVNATGEETDAPQRRDGRVVHRFVQGDVHDFAWTADKRTATPLEGLYNGAGSPPVKVIVLVPPEYAHNAAPVLKATLDALTYFPKTLGPYPYRTVTAVIPPFNATEAGGMEYPTFFAAAEFRDATPGRLASYALDFGTIHEFGRGYCYGILGSNEFEEPMLDKGLNPVLGFAHAPRARPARALDDRHAEAVRHSPVDRGVRRDSPDVRQRRPWRRAWPERLGPFVHWQLRRHAASKVDDRVESLVSKEVLPLFRTTPANGRWSELTEGQLDERVEAARKAWKKPHPDARKNDAAEPFPYRSTVTLRRFGAAGPQTPRAGWRSRCAP